MRHDNHDIRTIPEWKKGAKSIAILALVMALVPFLLGVYIIKSRHNFNTVKSSSRLRPRIDLIENQIIKDVESMEDNLIRTYNQTSFDMLSENDDQNYTGLD